MANATSEDATANFEPLRPKLMRVAYRMLGSVAEAEDMVQEAFIRWMKADRSEVREPEAFLRRTVTRLCLDQLKSARHQRETYVGPWLPDPLVAEEQEEDVTLPLMLALERLSPLELLPQIPIHHWLSSGSRSVMWSCIAAALPNDSPQKPFK